MRTEISSLVVDTYAWIEFFGGTKLGEKIKELLSGADYLYTPSIVLAEIARKYVREGISTDVVAQRLDIIEELSIIIDIDHKIALESGKSYLTLLEHAKKLKLKTKPSLTDAIILATAITLNAKVLTGDQHFKGLEITVWPNQKSM